MVTLWLPSTSTVRMNWDSTHTAVRDRASPTSRAYRRRNRARKKGTPDRPAGVTVHCTFSPSARAGPLPCRVTVRRRRVGSSHSTFQNWIPFWAHRLRSRSGKAPVTSSRTLPRRALTIRFSMPPPPYSSSTAVMTPVIRSWLAFMLFSSSPVPITFTTSLPPDMWISSSP